jgi:hypothetical protein
MTMQRTIEILDPRAPRACAAEAPLKVLETLEGKVVGFIDNTKPNFNHLVDDLADVLARDYGVRSVLKRAKRVQSIPAPDEVVDELARECDLIITGSGD